MDPHTHAHLRCLDLFHRKRTLTPKPSIALETKDVMMEPSDTCVGFQWADGGLAPVHEVLLKGHGPSTRGPGTGWARMWPQQGSVPSGASAGEWSQGHPSQHLVPSRVPRTPAASPSRAVKSAVSRWAASPLAPKLRTESKVSKSPPVPPSPQTKSASQSRKEQKKWPTTPFPSDRKPFPNREAPHDLGHPRVPRTSNIAFSEVGDIHGDHLGSPEAAGRRR